MADMAKVLADLQDTVVVMAGIQQRQAAVVKEHTEWLVQHERAMTEIRELGRRNDEQIAALLEAGKRTDARIEALVSAIGEFLRKER